MHLDENNKGAAVPSYKLYVDLDGVLVDFDREMERIGFKRADVEGNSKAKSRFWAKVGAMAKNGEAFWGVMHPMADAHVLWDYVKKYSPEILSATGHVGNATQEKYEWMERFAPKVPTHLVKKSADKAQFAAPNHILIDDRAKSIEPWVAAGGIGILHVSAADTIRQLKELGL